MSRLEPETYEIYQRLGGELTAIGNIYPGEYDALERSRGETIDPIGFNIERVSLSMGDFHKATKDLECAEFPIDGKGIKTRIFYGKFGDCYVEKLNKNKDGKPSNEFWGYETEDRLPTKDEVQDYELEKAKYEAFLDKYDMENPLAGEPERANYPQIVSAWGHSDKVDIFSNISEEQRSNFVVALWVASVTWMSEIPKRIDKYLRYGHAVGGSLMKRQGEIIKKGGEQPVDTGESGGFLQGRG